MIVWFRHETHKQKNKNPTTTAAETETDKEKWKKIYRMSITAFVLFAAARNMGGRMFWEWESHKRPRHSTKSSHRM